MTVIRSFRAVTISLGLIVVAGLPQLAVAQGKGASLKDGEASGTLTQRGKSVKLTHAYAFVDATDKRKPVILYLTDKPIPAAKTESDLRSHRASTGFSGIGYWLDPKDYDDIRNEVCIQCGGNATSLSGMFKIKFDKPPGKTLTGTISLNNPANKDYATDAAFSVTVK
jgi:hypothetical protein